MHKFFDIIDNFDHARASRKNTAKQRHIFTLVYMTIALIICRYGSMMSHYSQIFLLESCEMVGLRYIRSKSSL